MKLRIHGNGIRLRLNRREVAEFHDNGTIRDVLRYGDESDETFCYGLEVVATPEIAACMSPGQITILVPRVLADDWTATDRVAMHGEQRTGGAQPLTILVEKEFRRVHGGNSDPDLYPNPLEQQR